MSQPSAFSLQPSSLDDVAVLGAGNWGTTVAVLVAAAGRRVTLWTHSAAQRDEINDHRRNRRYTGETELPQTLRATCDLREAVEPAHLVVPVIPSKAFREVAAKLGEVVRPDHMLVHGTKGLEPGTHLRMSEILRQETCVRQLGVLSGPNLAGEILQGQPAGTVIASRFPRVVAEGQKALSSVRLRVFANEDVTGVEYAGAFKNVVAIAAGMASAMGMGENARAMLVTRGISEIARLGVALGAQPLTFFGMAGFGDLVATCSSPESRNHRVGAALARGDTLETAQQKLGMVAEGVNTARVAYELLRARGIESPLLEAVYRVVHEGLTPQQALQELMSRKPGVDIQPALRLTAVEG